MKDKFEYNYTAPTVNERKEIESIRNQYLPKDNYNLTLEKLRKLDNKVKQTPLIYGLTFGVIGLLLFGLAMSFFLEITNLWYLGIPSAIIGVIIMALAYPVYNKVYTKLKNKYKDEIIKLSNELLEKDK